MLRFVWTARHGGAPDASGYGELSDRLSDADGNELLAIGKAAAPPYAPGRALLDRVGDWLRRAAADRVVLMCHGYAFNPDDSEDAEFDEDPYHRVYASPGQAAHEGESWLAFVPEDRAIAFAWTSAPTFGEYAGACWTNPYEYAVLDVSPWAARALAAVVEAVREAGEGRVAVDVVAHSLGTRVVLQALRLLARGGRRDAVARMILMGGAEYSLDARQAVRGTQTQVLNFVIRRDSILKWGASELGGRLRLPNTVASRVIGRDGMAPEGGWMDLQLDHRDAELGAAFDEWFKKKGYALSGEAAGGRGLHWAYYMNAGNRRLYRDVLGNPEMTAAAFRREGAVEGVDRFNYGLLRGRVPRTPQTCRGRKDLYRTAPVTR